MNQFLFIISLLSSAFVHGQVWCGGGPPEYIDFETSTPWDYTLTIDTISNPGNVWQIGQPQKTIIDSAYSWPNVIITDTVANYPVNDTSSFIIAHVDIGGYSDPSDTHWAEFGAWYWSETDSLNDFGLIEFSPDNGASWIDITDPVYDPYISWSTPKPTLTGSSGGWQYIYASLSELGFYFSVSLGDTILFKFTFISDSNPDAMDGLAFDSFSFCDGVEGIKENKLSNISSMAYPSPADQAVTIQFENPQSSSFELTIYDNAGQRILIKTGLNEENVTLDTGDMPSGMYHYYLANSKDRKWTAGKFTVNR